MSALRSRRPRRSQSEARTYSERLDRLDGFWPGLQFALALATLTAVATVGVLVPWLWLSEQGTAGVGIVEGVRDPRLIVVTAWWGLFWLVLSLVLLGGLWLGYRAWESLYPLASREATRRRETRDAIDEATAILDEARRLKRG